MVFAFMTTLRLGGASRTRDWAWCGATWSFAALLNPALLAPLPVLAVNAALRTRRWKQFVLMALVCVLGVLPWTARNFRVFGKFIPVRSNFWAEVYFGNVDFSVHPVGKSMLYQQEGELRFVAGLKQGALNFVRSNPSVFIRMTRKRTVSFWTQPSYLRPYPLLLLLVSMGGIVQASRRRKRWLGFASVLLLYPLIYYITYTFARYRYPIEPLMYALGGYSICELYVAGRKRLAPSPGDASVLPA
jgi:hypothetical protein